MVNLKVWRLLPAPAGERRIKMIPAGKVPGVRTRKKTPERACSENVAEGEKGTLLVEDPPAKKNVREGNAKRKGRTAPSVFPGSGPRSPAPPKTRPFLKFTFFLYFFALSHANFANLIQLFQVSVFSHFIFSSSTAPSAPWSERNFPFPIFNPRKWRKSNSTYP